MRDLGVRKLGGRKAQSEGAHFEASFQAQATRQGIAITRVPDGCRQLSQARLIRVKSPFDFILSYRGQTVLIDTKSIAGETYHRSSAEKNHNQILELHKHEIQGVRAGYVIHARKANRTFFIPASVLIGQPGDTEKWNAVHRGVVLLGNESTDLKLLFNAHENLCPPRLPERNEG